MCFAIKSKNLKKTWKSCIAQTIINIKVWLHYKYIFQVKESISVVISHFDKKYVRWGSKIPFLGGQKGQNIGIAQIPSQSVLFDGKILYKNTFMIKLDSTSSTSIA